MALPGLPSILRSTSITRLRARLPPFADPIWLEVRNHPITNVFLACAFVGVACAILDRFNTPQPFAWALLMLCAILQHEGAHIIAMSLLGAPCDRLKFSLFLLGASVHPSRPLTLRQWPVVVLAGPAADFVLALYAHGIGSAGLNVFAMMWSWNALMNLVPIRPTDGSKIVRGLLATARDVVHRGAALEVRISSLIYLIVIATIYVGLIAALVALYRTAMTDIG